MLHASVLPPLTHVNDARLRFDVNASYHLQGTDDPLEKYCEEVPEADECRVYED